MCLKKWIFEKFCSVHLVLFKRNIIAKLVQLYITFRKIDFEMHCNLKKGNNKTFEHVSACLHWISNFLINQIPTRLFVKTNRNFCFQLILSHGLEADRHLLRCLFSHIDLSVEGSRKTNGNSKDCLQIQLLIQECANLLSKPTLISNVCYAVDNPLHHQKVNYFTFMFLNISLKVKTLFFRVIIIILVVFCFFRL